MTFTTAEFTPPPGWVEIHPAVGATDWAGAPGTALMTVGCVGEATPRVFKRLEDVP